MISAGFFSFSFYYSFSSISYQILKHYSIEDQILHTFFVWAFFFFWNLKHSDCGFLPFNQVICIFMHKTYFRKGPFNGYSYWLFIVPSAYQRILGYLQYAKKKRFDFVLLQHNISKVARGSTPICQNYLYIKWLRMYENSFRLSVFISFRKQAYKMIQYI